MWLTDRRQLKAKMSDKSHKCIMVGYADNHSSDTYRVYDPETRKIRLTRDVKWAEWKRTDPSATMRIFEEDETHHRRNPVGISEEDSEDEDEPPGPVTIPPDEEKEDETGRKERDSATKRSKVERALARLDWMGDQPQVIENDDDESVDDSEHTHSVYATLSSDPGEPKTLKEALEGEDSEEWKISMSGEVMNFLRRGAWKKVPKAQVLREGRKATPTKIIFKVKDEQDGTK
jgi:hypothetical protein